MTWTNPTHVSSGEADSAKFNEETVDNLLHLYDLLSSGKKLYWSTFFSGTTAADGNLTVTHGAGFTPAVVLVTPRSPQSGGNIFGQAVVDSLGATTFRVRCFSTAGAVLNAVAVTGHYLCLGS